jgi:hypothetical protein
MSFLDFIKNRQQAEQEQASQPKPETAKEMYSRQAEQESAGRNAVAQIPDADKAQAKELGARLDKATQHIQQGASSSPEAPADGASSPEPMRQNMTAQDKEAPALSPTSGQRGAVEHEQESPAPSQGSRPQTIARTTPSWER